MSIRDYYNNEISIKIEKNDIKSLKNSIKSIEKMLKSKEIRKIEMELKIGYYEPLEK